MCVSHVLCFNALKNLYVLYVLCLKIFREWKYCEILRAKMAEIFETAETMEWQKKRNTIEFLVFYAN